MIPEVLEPKPASQSFVVTAHFDASRERLWRAWTERKALMQWFRPKGFTMPAAIMDLRAGGMFHYCLCAPDGEETWSKFVYREIDAPGKITLINSHSDEDGELARYPSIPTWPMEILITVLLQEAGSKTAVIIQLIPLNPTEKEQKSFADAYNETTRSWNDMFEQLAEHLANN